MTGLSMPWSPPGDIFLCLICLSLPTNSLSLIQPAIFDEQDLAEIADPERPHERLVACRNPLVAEQRRRKREELLQTTETALSKIQTQVEKVVSRRRRTSPSG